MKAEVLKGQHKIVFKGLFASEVHQVWKMTENLGACYGVQTGAREPVKNLFSLLTKSSMDEDIRSGFYRENERARTFRHRQGLLQSERPDLISEIRYCGQPGKKRVKA
ncbi:hypothetical protein TB2_025493 [Malus domestica]